ncbi:hypothetical protein BV25DRAFT_1996449 [Artomyces pyxidatus]|uniref:Uncharacterized protein n=1 Tax=Artomyces pyxidatus TaxID=48021 RepID=A0ACB8SDA8_9AGAM|nr:hypothetical protein BV25DRAFT_1996449 [Artomyces pyxidatus]
MRSQPGRSILYQPPTILSPSMSLLYGRWMLPERHRHLRRAKSQADKMSVKSLKTPADWSPLRNLSYRILIITISN